MLSKKPNKIICFKSQKVQTIDISEDGNYWVAGSSSGELYVKKSGKMAKRHYTKLSEFKAILQI